MFWSVPQVMMLSMRVMHDALVNHVPVGFHLGGQSALFPGLSNNEWHHVDVDSRRFGKLVILSLQISYWSKVLLWWCINGWVHMPRTSIILGWWRHLDETVPVVSQIFPDELEQVLTTSQMRQSAARIINTLQYHLHHWIHWWSWWWWWWWWGMSTSTFGLFSFDPLHVGKYFWLWGQLFCCLVVKLLESQCMIWCRLSMFVYCVINLSVECLQLMKKWNWLIHISSSQVEQSDQLILYMIY